MKTMFYNQKSIKSKREKASQGIIHVDWKQCVMLNVIGKMPIRALSKLDLLREDESFACDDDLFVCADDASVSFDELSNHVKVQKLQSDCNNNYKKVSLIDTSNSPITRDETSVKGKKIYLFIPLSILLGRLLLSLQYCLEASNREIIRQFAQSMLHTSLGKCQVAIADENGNNQQGADSVPETLPENSFPCSVQMAPTANLLPRKQFEHPFTTAMRLVEECSDATFANSLQTMKGIVPSTIFSTSLKEVINSGLAPSVAQRIWEKRILWLMWMTRDDIAKMHISDLRGRFHYHGLDLMEMQAVWTCLPHWEGASPKAMWKNDFKSKLVTMLVADMANTLSPNDKRNNVYNVLELGGVIVRAVEDSSTTELPPQPVKPIEVIKYAEDNSKLLIAEELRWLSMNRSFFEDDCSSNDEETPLTTPSKSPFVSKSGSSRKCISSAGAVNHMCFASSNTVTPQSCRRHTKVMPCESPIPINGLQFEGEIDEMALVKDEYDVDVDDGCGNNSSTKTGSRKSGCLRHGRDTDPSTGNRSNRRRSKATTAVSSAVSKRLSFGLRSISIGGGADNNNLFSPGIPVPFTGELSPIPLSTERPSIHGFTTPSSRILARLLAAANAEESSNVPLAGIDVDGDRNDLNNVQPLPMPETPSIYDSSRPKPVRRLTVKSSVKKAADKMQTPRLASLTDNNATLSPVLASMSASSGKDNVQPNNIVQWMDDLAQSPVPITPPASSSSSSSSTSSCLMKDAPLILNSYPQQTYADKENSLPTRNIASTATKSVQLSESSSKTTTTGDRTLSSTTPKSNKLSGKKKRVKLSPRPSLAARLTAEALLNQENLTVNVALLHHSHSPAATIDIAKMNSSAMSTNKKKASISFMLPSMDDKRNDDSDNEAASDINFYSPCRDVLPDISHAAPSALVNVIPDDGSFIQSTETPTKDESSTDSLENEKLIESDWLVSSKDTNDDNDDAAAATAASASANGKGDDPISCCSAPTTPVLTPVPSPCGNNICSMSEGRFKATPTESWKTFWTQIRQHRQQLTAEEEKQEHDIEHEIDSFIIPDELTPGTPKQEMFITYSETIESNQLLACEANQHTSRFPVRNIDFSSPFDKPTTSKLLTFDMIRQLDIGDIRQRIKNGDLELSKSRSQELLMAVCCSIDSIEAPLESLMLLIDVLGANPNYQSENTLETPLHYLFMKPLLGRYLISRGASVLLPDANGDTVLQLTLDYGFDWIVAALESSGREAEILQRSGDAIEYARILLTFGGYGTKVKSFIDSKLVVISPTLALSILEYFKTKGSDVYSCMKQPVETFELLENIVLER